MTPDEFYAEMKALAEENEQDLNVFRQEAGVLMSQLLESLGYEKGAGLYDYIAIDYGSMRFWKGD
jgi:hypothetical protein